LQYVALQRSLSERKIVEDPQRRRVNGCVGRDAAHQKPGQESEQQTHHADAGGDLT
jgi:hypothetical protein